MGRRQQKFENRLNDMVVFQPWTIEELVATRKKLGLRQRDISDLIGLTPPAISALETGKVTSVWAINLYGVILERYYAALKGYIPAYRKLGQSQFIGEDTVHKEALENYIEV